MVVLATNSPQLLDEAIQDRIDELVYFDKPSLFERKQILLHYLLKYCNPTGYEHLELMLKHPTILLYGKKKMNIDLFADEYVLKIAAKTEGFSGRELTKLVVAWQDAAFAMDTPVLYKELIEEILDRHIEQNKTKDKWNVVQKEYFNKMHH